MSNKKKTYEERTKLFQEGLNKLQKELDIVVAPVISPSMSAITAELKMFDKQKDINDNIKQNDNSKTKKVQ
jgi:hypothetical protein